MARSSRTASFKDMALAALFSLLIIWFAYLIWGIVPKEERARMQVRETESQLASLEAREAQLRESLEELNTERGKEAVMRDTKGVALPGEEVIIVVPPEPELPPLAPRPWWKRMFDWF